MDMVQYITILFCLICFYLQMIPFRDDWALVRMGHTCRLGNANPAFGGGHVSGDGLGRTCIRLHLQGIKIIPPSFVLGNRVLPREDDVGQTGWPRIHNF